MVFAAAGGLAALGLTPVMRRVAAGDSAWLRSWVHVPLAVLGSLGAATLATTAAEALAYAVLAVACALLVVIDLAVFRLPDAIVGPTCAALIILLGIAAVFGGTPGRWGRALAAGVVLFVLYYGLALLRRSGIGFGDVKLAGLLGLFLGWLGWPSVLAGTLATFALGGVWAALLLLTRRSARGGSYPYGPWMVLGAAVGAAWVAVTA